MKQVGIFTMSGGLNYGNRLQNYAVEQTLRTMGYSPVTMCNATKRGFLCDVPSATPLWQKLRPSHLFEHFRDTLFQKYGAKNTRDCTRKGLRAIKAQQSAIAAAMASRKARFETFDATYLHLSAPVDETAAALAAEDYAAFVCGSDQVWNPNYRQNSALDFLQFAPPHQRIPFAPSFGVPAIPTVRREAYAKWLSEFPMLSVREQDGAAIIKELTGRDAVVLPDPTMLLDAKDWRALAVRPVVLPDKPYVFSYFLGDRTKRYGSAIDALCKAHDWAQVDLCDVFDLAHYDCPPTEFLYLLDHAACVCTDSFHGAVFAILLQKPFCAFPRSDGKQMHGRMQTLLSKFGLESCLYRGKPLQTEVDFSATPAILEAEREKTRAFLTQAFAIAEAGNQKRALPILALPQTCTGCGACAAACPKGCITLRPDAEGFLRPVVDASKCLGCGACRAHCPVLHPASIPKAAPAAFAVTAKDATLVQNSSSGGAFSLLAQEILARGGAVFGAALDETQTVRHICVRDEKDLFKLRTSKYVQSDLGDSLFAAKRLLDSGVTVLFCGTPCQIAGLYAALGRTYDSLFTQDIICHGVPSPKVFATYLHDCHGTRPRKTVNFRDKTHGWNSFGMRVDDYQRVLRKDAYLASFLGNVCLRPCCYRCLYKTAARQSDVTLADFWGVEDVLPDWKDDRGVSLVLVQSEKGQALFDAARDRATVQAVNAADAIGQNHAALHSVACPQKRALFFEKLGKTPFEPLTREALRLPFLRRFKRGVRITLSRIKHAIIK